MYHIVIEDDSTTIISWIQKSMQGAVSHYILRHIPILLELDMQVSLSSTSSERLTLQLIGLQFIL